MFNDTTGTNNQMWSALMLEIAVYDSAKKTPVLSPQPTQYTSRYIMPTAYQIHTCARDALAAVSSQFPAEQKADATHDDAPSNLLGKQTPLCMP